MRHPSFLGALILAPLFILSCFAREKEEDEDEDEDDGFGTLNISAHRLPTEDNALTRFFRRAIANNGEVGTIQMLEYLEVCLCVFEYVHPCLDLRVHMEEECSGLFQTYRPFLCAAVWRM